MKKRPLLFIGLRFVLGKRSKSVPHDLARKAVRGAILSVAISLVPLIIVMQVSGGMIQGITARYIELGTYHLQARGFGVPENLSKVRDLIRENAEVTGAWLEARSAGVVFVAGRQEGVAIRAVENDFLDFPSTNQYLEVLAGEAQLTRPVDALIGSALAEKLAISEGSAINLITLRTLPDGRTLPRISIFIIRGIVSAGYRELDAHWLFIPYDAAERIMEAASSERFVGIKVADPYQDTGRVQFALARQLPPAYRLHSWQQLERNLFASLANTQTILLLIMAITVVVAAVNITSALSTLAMERASEIAILKCMGAGHGDIALIFSVTGAFLGAFGSLLGSAGGMLLSMHVNQLIHAIERILNTVRLLLAGQGRKSAEVLIRLLEPSYYLEKIPIDINYQSIAVIILTTIIVSFFAALFPARRGARLVPLDIFRKHA